MGVSLGADERHSAPRFSFHDLGPSRVSVARSASLIMNWLLQNSSHAVISAATASTLPLRQNLRRGGAWVSVAFRTGTAVEWSAGGAPHLHARASQIAIVDATVLALSDESDPSAKMIGFDTPCLRGGASKHVELSATAIHHANIQRGHAHSNRGRRRRTKSTASQSS